MFMKKFEFKMFTIAMLLSVIHLWQYFDSGYNINCIIRCVLIFTTGVVGLFLKKNFIYIACYIISAVIMYLNAFNNYSYFFFAYILIRRFPKYKFYVLMSYLVNIFIVCEMHSKNASHLGIHFLTCIALYLLAEESDREILLDLTNDEKKILYQLEIEHKTFDSLYGFSKQTALRRLEKAVERNNCKDNAHLRILYADNFIPV